MKFIKDKDIFYRSYETKEVGDKKYITICFDNEEGDKEYVNFNGNVEELENLENGSSVRLYFKIYRDRDSYYKLNGLSIYKIELI